MKGPICWKGPYLDGTMLIIEAIMLISNLRSLAAIVIATMSRVDRLHQAVKQKNDEMEEPPSEDSLMAQMCLATEHRSISVPNKWTHWIHTKHHPVVK